MSTTDIKEDTKELAKQLKGLIKIGENGVATIKEGTYVDMLPEGITEDDVKKLQTYNSNLVAAGALAIGEMGIDYMKKHKDVAQVELSIPMVGKDTMGLSIKRTKNSINPQTKEPITTYGAINASINTYSTKPRGELSRVKDHLAELAMKSLG